MLQISLTYKPVATNYDKLNNNISIIFPQIFIPQNTPYENSAFRKVHLPKLSVILRPYGRKIRPPNCYFPSATLTLNLNLTLTQTLYYNPNPDPKPNPSPKFLIL